MKFSSDTLSILKNFNTINQSIIMKPGNQLKTISPQKTVMAIANIEEEIPATACIYDLAKFLSVYSIYTDPDFEFQEKNFIISENKKKTKYIFADQSMVIAPPEKELKLPTIDVEIELKNEDFKNVLKASSVLGLPEIAFVGEDGLCFIRAIDSANDKTDMSKDTFGIEIGETSDTFTMIFKTENLKLMELDYTVSLSSKGISKFENEKIKYFVAVESKSTYVKGD